MTSSFPSGVLAISSTSRWGASIWRKLPRRRYGHGHGDPRRGRVPRGPNEARSMGEARQRSAIARSARPEVDCDPMHMTRYVEDDQPAKTPTNEA